MTGRDWFALIVGAVGLLCVLGSLLYAVHQALPQ